MSDKQDNIEARQTLIGRVVSTKMDKTVVVQVERTIMHSLYQRYMRRNKKYHAHDEANACNVGDEVVIMACRPLSKTKQWRVREVLKQAEVIS
ncbi:MAG: 30S ribosomal protein S17 [Thermoanaerobaculia bacterium]|nr:30S ribosomal protein S17 [Thermoanaerobaculia bacterium]